MELDKLAPAIVALQAELVPVEKSADNPFFRSKYAPLPEVRATMQPLLAKHKLALVTMPAIVQGQNGLRWYLIHESGQYLEGEWMLTPKERSAQAEGSDVTYKRRYGEMAITGLVADEDDDGNAASAPPKQEPRRQSRSKPAASSPSKDDDLKGCLEDAKSRLRAAIRASGVDAKDYAWVKDATVKDIDNIVGLAEALEMGKAVSA